MIQEKAESVPELQSRITQLETELQHYRSFCTCIPDSLHLQMYPIRAEDTCSKTEDTECLQRAVEGRAASDEEEDNKGMREEAISQMHVCGKGCQKHVVNQLSSQCHLREKNHISTSKDSRRRCNWKGQNQEQPVGSREFEKVKRPEEDKDTNMRLKEEKTRLSLLEEKLTDALTLLLQLRNKNVSRRALGKIVMDTLDVCSRTEDGPSQVLQVADALFVQLSSWDLLGIEADDEAGENREKLLLQSSGCQTSSVNPLLISC